MPTGSQCPIPREILVKVGQKARRLWQALNTAGLAPSSWGKASEVAYNYFNCEMLNEPAFEFFRYCEGNWKLTRWATKAYASWKHNHLKSGDTDNRNTSKRKRELLDDPSLLQIGDEQSENTPSGSTPVETCGLALPIESDVCSSLSHVSIRSNLSHY